MLRADVTSYLSATAYADRSFANKLVIISLAALGEIREGLRLRTIVENLAWRALFVWSVVALALGHLRTTLGWLPLPQVSGHPSLEVLRAVAAAIVATAAATTAVEVRSGYRKLGRQEPAFLDLLTVALPAVGGVLAFALYP